MGGGSEYGREGGGHTEIEGLARGGRQGKGCDGRRTEDTGERRK